jgi:hypothetical protein
MRVVYCVMCADSEIVTQNPSASVFNSCSFLTNISCAFFIIPANHTFVTLDKNTEALTGQRLVRLIAKSARGTDKPSNPNLAQSMAVSIPYITMEEVVEHIDKLIPHVIGLVQDTQDKIIREYRIESGAADINQSLIDVGAVIAYLDASATGERVSKEYLQDWFTSEYAEVAKAWINRVAGGN